MSAAEIKIIKERIVKKAVKQDNLDRGKFKIGSYVRLRNYKSTKTGTPPFTDGSRKFSEKEDLRALHRSNQMVVGASADVDLAKSAHPFASDEGKTFGELADFYIETGHAYERQNEIKFD
jgi:hypothetical protein